MGEFKGWEEEEIMYDSSESSKKRYPWPNDSGCSGPSCQAVSGAMYDRLIGIDTHALMKEMEEVIKVAMKDGWLPPWERG